MQTTQFRKRSGAGDGSQRYELALPTSRLGPFAAVVRRAGWAIEDTGRRIATDDGPDAEAVVLVTVPAVLEAPGAARRAGR